MLKFLRFFFVVLLSGFVSVGFAQNQTASSEQTTTLSQDGSTVAEQFNTIGKGVEALILLPEFKQNQGVQGDMKKLQGELQGLQESLQNQTSEQVKTSLEGMQKSLNELGPRISGETAQKVGVMVKNLNVQIDGLVKNILTSTGKLVDHTVNQAMDQSMKAVDDGLKLGMDAANDAMNQAQQDTDTALKESMQGVQTSTGE
ncbi:MAG: hypothetical protein WA705_19165 [Candidatus Ozemobacteraceae bacterium]